MSALGEALAALAGVLDDLGIGWCVFGAQAVAVRGAPRATQDIDVTAAISRDVLPSVLQALADVGVTPRYPEQLEALLASAAVVPLSHISGMEVDLVLAGSGLEAIALERAERIVIDGTSVPVAHATDLVVMKVLAGRGKDLEDVRGILAGGEVDLDETRDLLTQLEEALDQADLLPAFERALSDVTD